VSTTTSGGPPALVNPAGSSSRAENQPHTTTSSLRRSLTQLPEARVRPPLAHPCTLGYHSRAMLSRAQEARVRDILGNHPPGIIQTYCLEHLAAAVKIPREHLADLAAFVRGLREHGACQTRYGGTCDADAHETDRVLIWGPPTPMAPAEPNTGGGHAA